MRIGLMNIKMPALFILPVIGLFFNQSVFSQSSVKGKVTDDTGKPLVGATVTEKGTTKSTTTNENGEFTLALSRTGAKLVFSFIGFATTEIPVNNRLYITVVMNAIVSNLDQVVVIGYGTARKKDLTGAVASISEKDFNKGIYSSADQLIQGKVSGVEVFSNNGAPGGSFTVKIRGNAALTGTGQPLYVVDGVPLNGNTLQANDNPLNFLSTSDIASVDILKDASATAIYGSRAAFGVVIINTKKGQEGAPKLDASISAGASSILKNVRVLNASEYRDAIAYYDVSSVYDKGSSSNGMEAVLRTAGQQNYSLAASGGNENGRYRVSAGYLNQDGIIINSNFKKFSSDISGQFRFLESKKLGLDFQLNSSQYINQGSDLVNGNRGTTFFGLTWNPTTPLYHADGSLVYWSRQCTPHCRPE